MIKTFCNLCGKEFDEIDHENAYHLGDMVGYGSAYDGKYVHIDCCSKCIDKIIELCTINPIIEPKEFEF